MVDGAAECGCGHDHPFAHSPHRSSRSSALAVGMVDGAAECGCGHDHPFGLCLRLWNSSSVEEEVIVGEVAIGYALDLGHPCSHRAPCFCSHHAPCFCCHACLLCLCPC